LRLLFDDILVIYILLYWLNVLFATLDDTNPDLLSRLAIFVRHRQRSCSMKNTQAIYQLKITLLRVKPTVWRRILVPGDYTFFDLHVAIQSVMPWSNDNLHIFSAGNTQRIEMQNESSFDSNSNEILDEENTKISSILNKPRAHIFYENDMFDSRKHKIVLEKILTRDPKIQYPSFIPEKRVNLAKDFSPAHSYHEKIEALGASFNDEYKESAFNFKNFTSAKGSIDSKIHRSFVD
jgi:hypothetical protein